MRHRNLLAAAWALAAAGLVIACAVLFARGAPLQTDLLALLPPTERNATAEAAVAALYNTAGNRAVFLVGHADRSRARDAARRFAGALRDSKAFASVQAEIPALDGRWLAGPYLEFRFGLLTDADRRSLAAGKPDPEAWLARALNSPLRLGTAGDVTLDPFGLLDNFLTSLPYRSGQLELDDGLLVTRDDGRGDNAYVLVTAALPGSAYDNAVQNAVAAAVAEAERSLRQHAPAVEVLRSGAVFFAGAARSAAEREVDLIGLGSLAGIVLLMLAVFRSLYPLLLGLLTVGIGLAAATTTTILVHRELHLLTLVFGASLIGEAIDYSIQYFAAHAQAGRAWDPWSGLHAVRPGLTLALATSLLGYAALLLVPFPAVNQIALFALAGLLAAYLSVVLLLPFLLRRPYAHDISAVTVPAGRFTAWWRHRVSRAAAAALALAVLVIFVPGWLRLQASDDVRAMADRSAPLLEQESRIRALTGLGIVNQFFLVEGDSPETVLRREEALGAKLRALAAGGELSHYHAVSSFVPSAARQEENRDLLNRGLLADRARLRQAFDRLGFRQGTAAAMERAYRESERRVLTPETWLASAPAAAFRHLWLGKSEAGYASVVVPYGFSRLAPLADAAAAANGVTLVDKAGSVSRLFREYRSGFSIGLAVAALVVLAVLSRRYGWKGGGAVLLPSLLGMTVALGAAGHAGVPVTLFSVMALMLVLGVGVNYAIFLVEGGGREGTTLVAVLLSAATTLLSFGLLAFSGTPALARFGATLLAGIGAAVLLAPLALTFAPPSRAAQRG